MNNCNEELIIGYEPIWAIFLSTRFDILTIPRINLDHCCKAKDAILILILQLQLASYNRTQENSYGIFGYHGLDLINLNRSTLQNMSFASCDV